MESLKVQDFLYLEYINGSFPKLNYFFLWSGLYPHKKIQKDPVVLELSRAHTYKQQTARQTNAPKTYSPGGGC